MGLGRWPLGWWRDGVGPPAIYGSLAVVHSLAVDLGVVKRDLGQITWTPSLVSTSWVMSTSQAVEMRA